MDENERNCDDVDPDYVPDEPNKEDEDIQEEQETSEKKRRPKFTIWKYFKRLSPASQKRARCRICLEVKSYRTSSTNLKSHLKFRHPKIMEQCLEPTRDETSAEVGTTETDIDNPVPPCKPRWRDPTIWKYFKRGPPNSEKIAQCNYCQQLRSYKTSITNLKTHLSLKHPEVVEQDQQLVRRILSGSNLSEMLVSDDRNSNHKPNENDNDSDLSETMEGHDEERNAENEQDENNAQQVKRVRPASDRGYSNIWNYFKKLEPFQEKLASCKYCHKIRSYRSSITNLKTHLVLKHPEDIQHDGYFTDKNYLARSQQRKKFARNKRKMWEFLEIETDNDEFDAQNDTNETGNVKFSSEIWRHFDVEDEEATCGLCRETTPSSLEHMKNHLEDKHASVLDDIAQKVLDAASEDDVLGDDDLYTEVVYLEDEPKTIDEQSEKPKKKLKPPKQKLLRVKTERRASTSSDELLRKPRRKSYDTTREPDELATFINYIAVLLKKVPKESSQKLHLDIINLIMNATQPQNKIVIETVNYSAANASNVSAILNESLILSHNGTSTSDSSTLNAQRVLTVPVESLIPQHDEKNTTSQVTASNIML